MTRGPHRSVDTRPSSTSSAFMRASSASGASRVKAEGAGVHEPVLIGLAPWGGAVEAGDRGELDPRLAGERAERAAQACRLVADIAAEREHDPRPAVVLGHLRR